MQKRIYALYMLCVLLFCVLCGCKEKEKVIEQQTEKMPDVQYETGNVTAFCVDEQEKIYTCEEGTETINRKLWNKVDSK